MPYPGCMARTDLSLMDCPIARTLDVIGEKWSLLIVRDAFYGVRRFDDFREDLGIARNVLADRLSKLVAQGVFERRQYEERPPRYEYLLTKKGRDLLPVLLTMMEWAQRWEAEDMSPVTLTHTTCGHDTSAVVTCAHCKDELRWRDLNTDPIPVRLPAWAGSR